MANPLEATPGAVFGDLTVLGRCVRGGKSYCLCLCSCGRKALIATKALAEISTSCGCDDKKLHRLSVAERQAKTDVSRAYRSWTNMWENFIPKPPEWQDFNNFLADMGGRAEEMTLDRVDTNLPYLQDNCRWASRHEQVVNRNCTIFYYNGVEVVDETTLAARLGYTQQGLKKRRARERIPEGWQLISHPHAVALFKEKSCPPTQSL